METKQQSDLIETYFSSGNYGKVVVIGDPTRWETYASMALIGRAKEALAGLGRFDGGEARFYEAVAYWMEGDQDEAARILERLAFPHAQNLLRLIKKPVIDVLSQVRHDDSHYYSIIDAISDDPKFRVRNLNYNPKDLPLRPYADIREYYNPQEPPDFYFCHQIEYQTVPPNIQELPCPVIGQTADYDLHVQAAYPWLHLFDCLVCTGETEHEDIARLIPRPVFTFPKMFGVDDGTIEIPEMAKEYDIFISGLLLHPYHADKARLVNEILRLPGYKVKVLNGMVGEKDYNMLLAQSKLCFTFVRHPGAMPSRGIEALHRGCAVVTQAKSSMNLYFGPEDGVYTYSGNDDFLPAIEHVLTHWPECEKQARRGAARIREEFTFKRCMSQYFRFLTVLAARTGVKRSFKDYKTLDHKKVLLNGGFQSATPAVYEEIFQENKYRWEARLKDDSRAELYVDYSRELTLYYEAGLTGKEDLDKALNILQEGIEKYPSSLVLRFNLIRVLWHFGSTGQKASAVEMIEEVLEIPPGKWCCNPLEDIFPYDFFNTYFNYRDYFDLVNRELSGGGNTEAWRVKLILASLRYYLSFSRPDAANLSEAVSLDPGFDYYKLRYAQVIVEKHPKAIPDAVAILSALFNDSLVFKEAYKILSGLLEQGYMPEGEFNNLTETINRVNRRTTPSVIDWEKLGSTRAVAIFGAGPTGRICLAELEKQGIEVLFFMDNAPSPEGTFEGKPVFHPQHLKSRKEVEGIILASGGGRQQMRAQLAELGFQGLIVDYIAVS